MIFSQRGDCIYEDMGKVKNAYGLIRNPDVDADDRWSRDH